MPGSPTLDTDRSTRAVPLEDPSEAGLVLRLRTGQYDGHVVRLQAARCSIGSGPDCTFRLRAGGIEPLHCLIDRIGPPQLQAIAGKTWLNNRPVTKASLQRGDRLQIGPVIVEVVALGQPAHRPEPPRPRREAPKCRPTSPAGPAPEASGLEHTVLRQLVEQQNRWTQDRQDLLLRLNQLQHELRHWEARVNRQQKRLAKFRKNWRVERARWQEAAHLTSQDQLDKQAAEQAQWQHRVHQWEQQRSGLQAEIEQLRQQQLHWQQQCQLSAGQILELQQTVELWKQKLDEQERLLVSERSRWEQERHALNQQLEHWQDLAATAQQQAERQDDGWSQRWEENRRELQQQIESLRERQNELELERTQAERRVEELERQVEHWKQCLELQQLETARQNDQWQEERAELELRLESTQSQLEQQISELSNVDEEELARRTQARLARIVQAYPRRDALAEELPAECPTAPSSDAESHESRESHESEADQNASLAESDPPEPQSEPATVEPNIRFEPGTLEPPSASATTEPIANELDSFRVQRHEDEPTEAGAHEADREQVAETAFVSEQERKEAPAQMPTSSTTKPRSPVSTAEVLARMGATISWDEDEQESSPAPPAANPIPTSASEVPPTRPQPAGHALPEENDEDSIEQYMHRLMNRVRGGELPTSNGAFATRSEPQPRSLSTPALAEREPAEITLSLTPSPAATTYAPRKAPERSTDLAAMRALANDTARLAIDHSRKERRVRDTVSKLFVSSVGFSVGTVLFLISDGFWTLVGGATVCYSVGVFWGVQAGLLIRQRIRERRREENPPEHRSMRENMQEAFAARNARDLAESTAPSEEAPEVAEQETLAGAE